MRERDPTLLRDKSCILRDKQTQMIAVSSASSPPVGIREVRTRARVCCTLLRRIFRKSFRARTRGDSDFPPCIPEATPTLDPWNTKPVRRLYYRPIPVSTENRHTYTFRHFRGTLGFSD